MAADQSSEKPSAADESLRLFLSRTQAREDPSAVYTFDGERGIARTVICREPSSQPETRQRAGNNTTGEQGKSRQKDCIALEMYSTQLFAAMQEPDSEDVIKSPGGDGSAAISMASVHRALVRRYSFGTRRQIDMQKVAEVASGGMNKAWAKP
ncbi:hypothetical protein EV401DRAFT_1885681 [Pisolithus croceorrhizus]|nr:hypothetical protein EV401DRAFT_1885681 [Pisolithus croceorrhizus]